MLGQGSAESGNGGMTINMVTRTGTNQLHGGGGVPGATWGRIARARNFTDKQKQDLLSSVPPIALAAKPDINPNADIDHSTDYSLWLAWAYVGLRVVHSLWQTLSNHIPVRFGLFFVSSLVLYALAIRAALLVF